MDGRVCGVYMAGQAEETFVAAEETLDAEQAEARRTLLAKEACTQIKYISVDDLKQAKFGWDSELTEKETKWVFHSSYEELHDEVFKAAPVGYKCVEPIALYHEVLWHVGLNANGVRDELHHALEREEYDMLRPGRGCSDWKKKEPLSLCVDIKRGKLGQGDLLTSSDPPSEERPAGPE
jgi:hypothetical protein